IACAFRTLKISWQYLTSGLSRVDPSAAAGVAATASRVATVSWPKSTRSDRVRLQDLEDFLAIFDVRLVTGGSKRSRRRRRDCFEVGDRLLAQIDEIRSRAPSGP